ncbi:MarR family transcriptional regulator [Leuconostoc falkenbergense]|uniref:MarR family winged helix-turn-helix transcriptional regulator n=1 Tax=Leuconostoc falkenbergense TaxID=2766470 RepID=UPI0024ACCA86|nr:MarR family transcriptional regulator [Leuconostoc falkenbergense]MDI6667032.1 MarR family transcriptional regulator [Leuconostoc falkenbergense]
MEKQQQFEKIKQLLRDSHSEDDAEQQWFLKHARSEQSRDFIATQKRFTHSELHILSQLVVNGNVTTFKILQQTSNLSQGMLSRYVNHLAQLTLIEKFHPQDNKKEISLRLTNLGKELGRLHLELHQRISTNEQKILEEYTDQEINTMLEVVSKLIAARQHI